MNNDEHFKSIKERRQHERSNNVLFNYGKGQTVWNNKQGIYVKGGLNWEPQLSVDNHMQKNETGPASYNIHKN